MRCQGAIDLHIPKDAAEAEAEASAARAAADLFDLPGARARLLPGGRVNLTFEIESQGRRHVIQRLNDFFQGDEALALNWRRVYEALEERGEGRRPALPHIRPGGRGSYLPRDDEGGFWRLTEFMPGRPAPLTPGAAESAAGLLGRLHRQLNCPAPVELLPLPEGEFTNSRFNRAEEFEDIVSNYRGHPGLEELKGLVERAAEAARRLPARPELVAVFNLKQVVIHGDPKAANFLFDDDGRALSLLDWDTVSLGHCLIDLAEMMRSWGLGGAGGSDDWGCPGAIVFGYAASGQELEELDLELLPAVLRGIALNLCRRYLVYALAQVYFHLDAEKYPSLYEQNKARAETMLVMADYLVDNEMPLIEFLKGFYEKGRAEADLKNI